MSSPIKGALIGALLFSSILKGSPMTAALRGANPAPGPTGNITFVGSGGGTVGTAGVTYNFSSLLDETGAAPTLQQGDLVVITTAYRTPTTPEWNQTPAGYTDAHADVFFSINNALSFKTTYKFMGATPDTSVTIPGADSANDGSFVIHIFRGVNAATPLDVTPVTTGATGAGHPTPGAITPITAGTWVYVAGAVTVGGSAQPITAPASLSTSPHDYVAANNNDVSVGAGFHTGWTSGAYTAEPFGGQLSGASAASASAAVALRPA